MKNIVYFILFCGWGAFAQVDVGKKFKPIPPVITAPATPTPKAPDSTTPSTISPTLPTPSLFDKNPEATKPLYEESKRSMMDQPKFVDPGKLYEKRLAKMTADASPPQEKKRSLGEIVVKTKKLIVKFKDSQEVDGDQVTLMVNGNLIERRLTLDGGYQAIEVDLEMGYNYIDLRTISAGSDGPNTAAYEFLDGDGVSALVTSADSNEGVVWMLKVIRKNP